MIDKAKISLSHVSEINYKGVTKENIRKQYVSN